MAKIGSYVDDMLTSRKDEKVKIDAAIAADKAAGDSTEARKAKEGVLKDKLSKHNRPVLKEIDGVQTIVMPDQSDLGFHLIAVDTEDTEVDEATPGGEPQGGSATPPPAPSPETPPDVTPPAPELPPGNPFANPPVAPPEFPPPSE